MILGSDIAKKKKSFKKVPTFTFSNFKVDGHCVHHSIILIYHLKLLTRCVFLFYSFLNVIVTTPARPLHIELDRSALKEAKLCCGNLVRASSRSFNDPIKLKLYL